MLLSTKIKKYNLKNKIMFLSTNFAADYNKCRTDEVTKLYENFSRNVGLLLGLKEEN